MFDTLIVVFSLVLYAWLQQFLLTHVLPDDFERLKQSQSADDTSLD